MPIQVGAKPTYGSHDVLPKIAAFSTGRVGTPANQFKQSSAIPQQSVVHDAMTDCGARYRAFESRQAILEAPVSCARVSKGREDVSATGDAPNGGSCALQRRPLYRPPTIRDNSLSAALV